MTVVVAYLGWVDNDFGHSTPCPVLLGHMIMWHMTEASLVNRARWWKSKIIVSQTRHATTRVNLYLLTLKITFEVYIQGVPSGHRPGFG